MERVGAAGSLFNRSVARPRPRALRAALFNQGAGPLRDRRRVGKHCGRQHQGRRWRHPFQPGCRSVARRRRVGKHCGRQHQGRRWRHPVQPGCRSVARPSSCREALRAPAPGAEVASPFSTKVPVRCATVVVSGSTAGASTRGEGHCGRQHQAKPSLQPRCRSVARPWPRPRALRAPVVRAKVASPFSTRAVRCPTVVVSGSTAGASTKSEGGAPFSRCRPLPDVVVSGSTAGASTRRSLFSQDSLLNQGGAPFSTKVPVRCPTVAAAASTAGASTKGGGTLFNQGAGPLRDRRHVGKHCGRQRAEVASAFSTKVPSVARRRRVDEHCGRQHQATSLAKTVFSTKAVAPFSTKVPVRCPTAAAAASTAGASGRRWRQPFQPGCRSVARPSSCREAPRAPAPKAKVASPFSTKVPSVARRRRVDEHCGRQHQGRRWRHPFQPQCRSVARPSSVGKRGRQHQGRRWRHPFQPGCRSVARPSARARPLQPRQPSPQGGRTLFNQGADRRRDPFQPRRPTTRRGSRSAAGTASSFGLRRGMGRRRRGQANRGRRRRRWRSRFDGRRSSPSRLVPR